LITLEEYLNSKIQLNKNKNLNIIKLFFSNSDLLELSSKSIAVVGTNGKTSTANYLYKIFISESKNTLLFTSPHLVNFSERIKSNRNIELSNYLYDLLKFEKDNNITLGYFEALFLISTKVFLDNNFQYYICEAGIGGKFDTTSLLQSKNVILTNIGYDHTELLGCTLEEILDQKIFISDIIENLFIGEEDRNLLSNIKNNYQHFKNIYHLRDFLVSNSLDVAKLLANDKNYFLALMSATRILNKEFQTNTLNFEEKFVQGRFEVVSKDPLKILDGAHNISGVKSFFRDLELSFNDFEFDIYLGFKEGKDYLDILDFLISKDFVNFKIIEQNTFFKQENPLHIEDYLKKYGKKYEKIQLEHFLENNNPSILLGSLYLIGEYKKRNL